MLLQKDFEHIVQKRTHELWKRTGILENCISTQVEMMYVWYKNPYYYDN